MARSFRALAILVALSAPPATAADADPVVVRVGTRTLKVSEVTRRLAALPSFQLGSFGDSPDQIRRRFVDVVLVPELLYESEAERRDIVKEPEVKRRIEGALGRELTATVDAEAFASGVSDDDVRAYYDGHPDDFQKPERIRLWRILVDDEALARHILVEVTGVGGPERWKALARDHSIDAATKMRGGMLGFVFPSGRTEVPQVRADPALYAAASKVKDGELVPSPVKEGSHFAVVWRRGTLPKEERKLETERDSIRNLLARQRSQKTIATLLVDLRARDVKDENPELLDALPAPAPMFSPRPRLPGQVRPVNPVPVETDRGLR